MKNSLIRPGSLSAAGRDNAGTVFFYPSVSLSFSTPGRPSGNQERPG
ncbi:hypothetical protein ACFTAO_16075 [Paenibacillus rhizoplanae]